MSKYLAAILIRFDFNNNNDNSNNNNTHRQEGVLNTEGERLSFRLKRSPSVFRPTPCFTATWLETLCALTHVDTLHIQE